MKLCRFCFLSLAILQSLVVFIWKAFLWTMTTYLCICFTYLKTLIVVFLLKRLSEWFLLHILQYTIYLSRCLKQSAGLITITPSFKYFTPDIAFYIPKNAISAFVLNTWISFLSFIPDYGLQTSIKSSNLIISFVRVDITC